MAAPPDKLVPLMATVRIPSPGGSAMTVVNNKWFLRSEAWLDQHDATALLTWILETCELKDEAEQLSTCTLRMEAARQPLAQRSTNWGQGASTQLEACVGQCCTCFLEAKLSVSDILDAVHTTTFRFIVIVPACNPNTARPGAWFPRCIT
eukprot:jgi/Tetstr1/434866/TSEL_002580.t1